jgi:hypothetical protein
MPLWRLGVPAAITVSNEVVVIDLDPESPNIGSIKNLSGDVLLVGFAAKGCISITSDNDYYVNLLP